MGKKKGTTAFPVARIKKMMQADEDVGKIATLTPTLVGKALECMLEDVLTAAAAVTHERRAKTIQPGHLREAIDTADKFDFLRGIVARVPLPEQNSGTAGRAPRTPKSTKLEPGLEPKPLPVTSKRPRSPATDKTVVKSSPQLCKRPRGPDLMRVAGQDCPPVFCAAEGTPAPPTAGVSAASQSPSVTTVKLPVIRDTPGSGPVTAQSSLGSVGPGDNDNEDDEDYDDEGDEDDANDDEEAETSSAGYGSAGSSAKKFSATKADTVSTTPNCGKRSAQSVVQISPMETEDEDNSSVQRIHPKLVEPIDFAPAPRFVNPEPVTINRSESRGVFQRGSLSTQMASERVEAVSFTLPNIPLEIAKPGNVNDDSPIERHNKQHTGTRSDRVSVMSLLS